MSRAAELLDGCRQLPGLELTQQANDALLAYLDLLEQWNKTYNLTAVRDPAELVSRHLLDSLSILPWIPGETLLDAGTGAGLPGVPLAIMRPALQVSLLDSAGKKVRFLRHVKRTLGLVNIHPVQQRLEEFSAEPPPQAIVSRAFAELGDFAHACRHLMTGQCRLLAMKGRHPDEELARLPGWIEVDRVEKLSVPGLHEQRHLVIMSLTA